MIPGRSLSAKTIGRSIAPVARTTSRARRCQSRSRARGEAPSTPRRRSCATIMFWSNRPIATVRGRNRKSGAARSDLRQRPGRMPGLRAGTTRPPAASASAAAAMPAAPAPTTTTSACRNTCSPGVSSISGTGAFPGHASDGQPLDQLDLGRSPQGQTRARQRPGRSAPRRRQPGSRAAGRGRCCARPRRPRSRAARTRRCHLRSRAAHGHRSGTGSAAIGRCPARRPAAASRSRALAPYRPIGSDSDSSAWLIVLRVTENQRRQPWLWCQRSRNAPFGFERKNRKPGMSTEAPQRHSHAVARRRRRRNARLAAVPELDLLARPAPRARQDEHQWATPAAPCSSTSAPVVNRSSWNGALSSCGSPFAIVCAYTQPDPGVALKPPVPQPVLT